MYIPTKHVGSNIGEPTQRPIVRTIFTFLVVKGELLYFRTLMVSLRIQYFISIKTLSFSKHQRHCSFVLKRKIGDGDIVRCGYRTRQHVLHQIRNELWVVLLKFNHVSCVALTQRCAVKLRRNIQLIRPLKFFYSRVDFIFQETLLQLFQIKKNPEDVR